MFSNFCMVETLSPLFGIVFAFCITSIPYFYLRLSK